MREEEEGKGAAVSKMGIMNEGVSAAALQAADGI